ncbi:MAG TPA: OsmC family protein [Pyrinomonadaceae bacterium]|nr:OsmC family protein [Pyrinomonadaceae bacterium]
METRTIINGLDMDQFNGTVEAIKETRTLARFQWRARNQWIDGGENRTKIKDFYGAGAEDTSRNEPWEFVNGEPPVLLGKNEGANPVEFLLHALAGCVTTTFVINAAARGINVESISTTLEGDMDLQGFLNLDPNVTPGYEAIRINMDVKADCSDAELEDLLQYTRDHSPVCQSVCRPVPVSVERVASVASR